MTSTCSTGNHLARSHLTQSRSESTGVKKRERFAGKWEVMETLTPSCGNLVSVDTDIVGLHDLQEELERESVRLSESENVYAT